MAASESDNNSHSTDLVELLDPTSTAPIDIARLVNHVRDPAAGAIATFEGTTRDTFDGRRVVELRYEAYEPMAIKRLAATCAAAREKWQLIRLAVSHRLGVVPVGEASVFVAASAVHRADAMEACRYVIDEIKAGVPIWKKEVYEDGEVWKENKEFFDSVGAAHDSNRKKGCCCGSKVRVEAEEEKAPHTHHTNGV
ncbi:Molybdopterin synthase catalytic subunit [Rhynchospora pubera]|uniref:Molybdopterin synthase catalytic subunit n=1 Tax=Rhynchospora pubera TaxID=906938 RepID=A0AAV8FN95_9POAL|nr:Molybdopterin synthase catalytic subunit [Rhynchospora pubera]